MLQTAKADVFNIAPKSSVKTRILFDNELCQWKSPQTFKSENYSYRETLIKTFGQINDFKMQILYVVQLKIKHQFEEKYNFVEALVVPVIYSPLKNQNIFTLK